MKKSYIADLNSTAFMIAVCFAHGQAQFLLAGLTVIEVFRCIVLTLRGL